MQSKEGSTTTWHRTALLPVAVILVSLLVISLVSANENGLTRGSRFTITVTGAPNTPYYVWLARTFTMSGEPGNQPPVLLANQANIVKDPPEGPYVIGQYQIDNGGGRTIREDVAPSTSLVSSTQYYALVTTDEDGRAIVAFQTSSATALRTFPVKVENARSIGQDTILVQRGNLTVKPGSAVIGTAATLPARTPAPIPVILPVTGVSPPVPATMVPLPPPAAPPAHRVPVGIGECIVATGAGILAGRRSA
jgi:hypothetical protein